MQMLPILNGTADAGLFQVMSAFVRFLPNASRIERFTNILFSLDGAKRNNECRLHRFVYLYFVRDIYKKCNLFN
jgi:hypothetical protein